MPESRSRRYRPVYVICIVIASFAGLLSVTWGGGGIAAWVEQSGKSKAVARVVETTGNRSSGHIVVEFTTRDDRRVRAEERRRSWPATARQGTDVEVVYDPEDPVDSVQRFQDLRRSLPWWVLFTVVAVLSGTAAHRTRPRAR
ncbi:DUF3592 domain-containing protein [Actinomadura vinacea]